jgi:capsular exopolysaccharide synthesis family protein
MSLPENGTSNAHAADAAAQPAGQAAPQAYPPQGRPVAPPAALVSAPNAIALLRALRRRWMLATGLGLTLGILGAAAVWFFLPPAKNNANVQLRINTEKAGKIHDHPDVIGESYEAYQSLQVHLIRSRMVLNAALRQPGVAQLSLFQKVPDAIEWLEHEVRVDYPSREILRITVAGEDLEELKTLVEAVKRAYMTEVVEKQTKDRQTRLEELRKILARYKEKLARDRRVKLDLAKKAAAPDSHSLATMAVLYKDQLRAAHGQLISIQEQIRQMEVAQALNGGQEGQPVTDKMVAAVLENEPAVTSRIAIILKLQETLEQTKKRAKNPNDTKLPAIKHLNDQIEAEQILLAADRSRLRPQLEEKIRDNMAQHSEHDRAVLRNNIVHAKALEKKLQEDIEKYGRLIDDAPGQQLTMNEIEFDIEQAESEVRTVTTAIAQLEIELNDPARVSPLQEAVAYKVDNLLRKVQLSVLAGVLGIGLSVFGVALLEFRSRRVSTVDEVTQGLGVRVVGTVPACPRRIRNRVASGGTSSYWKSMLAESVDAARTLLLHHARREGLRIIMVTSANGGEGKTSLSSHLAVSMARSGRKTLLIDCDLRNPSAHKLFNVALEPGVSSVLRGETSVEDAVHATQATGLWLMPAGACDAAALCMLAQDGMQPVFDRLRSEFDFIVVDSSPVLPVADSLMVAQQVDGVLFAILREVSRLPKVHEAYQKLVTLGVRMLGAVVNGTTSEVYGYGPNYSSGVGGYLAPTKNS